MKIHVVQLVILVLTLCLFVPVVSLLVRQARQKLAKAERHQIRASEYVGMIFAGIPYLIPLLGLVTVVTMTTFGVSLPAIPVDLVIALALVSMLAVTVSEQSGRTESPPSLRVFDNVEDSVGAIEEAIMRRLRKRKKVDIWVWAGGGLDSARRFHQMIEHAKAELTNAPQISVRVAMYDADAAERNGLVGVAKRGREAEEIFRGLKETRLVMNGTINLDYRKYTYAPLIQGTWVKGEALFMGAFYWKTKYDLETYPELISTPKPFMQIGTNHELYRFWTDVFENWFKRFWGEQ